MGNLKVCMAIPLGDQIEEEIDADLGPLIVICNPASPVTIA
jgi:hypothetical protein